MFAVLIGAACSWSILKLLIPHLLCRLLDIPNSRSSHSEPTPRGGGLSFVFVAFLSSVIALFTGQGSPSAALALIAFPLAVVGFIDDCRSLPTFVRYIFQLITAALIVFSSPLARRLSDFWGHLSLLLVLFAFLLLIAATALINFTNFMDGVDGLVAGCMAVSIVALATDLSLPWVIWTLFGSILGFLFWNWSPAKVFMGDVGSTFLGLLLVSTPLFADACLCVTRRFFAGQPVFQAHRLHLFQRLHQAGWPHALVSLAYILATGVLAVALLVGGWQWVITLSVLELIIGFWLDQFVAVPFAHSSSG